MIGRAVWIAGLFAIGCAVTGLQLDRQSRVSNSLASHVPGPFRAFAQARITATALAQNEPELALQEAKTLIQRRPLPAQNLRFLAAAQFRADRLDESSKTIQYAARRGWRDPLAQEAMMHIAMAAGDKSEAAKRFVALVLNTQASDDTLIGPGKQIFDEASDGRKALVELVSNTGRWHPAFVRRGLRVMPTDAYVEALVAANQNGVIFDCNQLRASHQSIERRSNVQEQANALNDLLMRQCQ